MQKRLFFLIAICCTFQVLQAQVPQALNVSAYTNFQYPEVEPAYNYDLAYPVYADVLSASPANYVPGMDNRYFMSLFGPRHKQTATSNIGYFDFHQGSDIVPDVTYNGTTYNENTPPNIHCMCDGTVYQIATPADPESTETGNYVTIRCNQNFAVPGWGNMYMAYRHLASITPGLEVGDTVTQGQVLGLMGATGATSEVHLHYSLIRRNTGVQVNVNAMRAFDPADVPHLLSHLTTAEIVQLETSNTTALFRIVVPRTMTNFRALEVTLAGTGYQRVYDFETISDDDDRDHNDLVSGLELFAYPFNQGDDLYKRVWGRYKDGQITAAYPASPSRGVGNFFPFLHEGLTETPAYALDVLVKDLPAGYDIEDLNIRLIDIWGYGVQANGVVQDNNRQFAWAMITNEDDDAEETNAGTMYTNSLLDFGYVTSSIKNQKVGLRFTNLGLPKNANILNAYVQLRSAADSAYVISATVKAEKTANSAAFNTTTKNITNRTTTTAAVPFASVPWANNDMGTNQQLGGLQNVVQETVNQGAWTTNSPLTFIVSSPPANKGGRRAYDYSAVTLWNNPYVYIEYTLPAPIAPPVVNQRGQVAVVDDVLVSPNPVTAGLFAVRLKEMPTENTTFSLMDMTGRLLSQSTVGANEGNGVLFNAQDLVPGIYLVTVSNTKGMVATKKIVVQQ